MKTRAIRLAKVVALGLLLWQLAPEGGRAEKRGGPISGEVRCPAPKMLVKAGNRDYDASGVRCITAPGSCTGYVGN